MNKKITIFTKIDNNQFINIENVLLTTLINEKIESFKEMQFTAILHTSKNELLVAMNSYLADILINNLLSNAIKHGKKGRGNFNSHN